MQVTLDRIPAAFALLAAIAAATAMLATPAHTQSHVTAVQPVRIHTDPGPTPIIRD